MKKVPGASQAQNIRLEINPETLVRLLRNRQMAAVEVKCLDHESRQRLRELCLESMLD